MAPKILTALDTAKTQYYHFKAIIIAGMGMFTDAYDLFCIPPIMTLIGRVYYDDDDDITTAAGATNLPHHHHRRYEVTPAVASTMLGIALLGTAVGQLIFGRLGDCRGRRKVYGSALLLMVFSSIGCGFSVCTSRICVLISLGFFRFLLGLGIGGDYPLSATIMSEFSNKNTRGAFIAGVFSMQGFGILVSSAVTMVVCAVFNRASDFPPPPDIHHNPTPKAADLAWRLILMIGAIPAALTFYWRISMPETPRYTALVEKNELQATKDMQKVLDMSAMVISTIPEDEVENFSTPSTPPTSAAYGLCSREFFRRHGRDLFACSISWFLVDIVFYSSNLFQSHIYRQFLPDPNTVNAYEEAFHVAKLQAIVAVCSTIPGYFATVFFIDRIGRVKIQMLGFFSVAICLFAIGIPYSTYWNDEATAAAGAGKGKTINITDVGFMILYGLTFFFSNFGPNTTTFIVPAELFPARFRSTCHGISGAIGKIGAIIGSVGFLWASQSRDLEINGYGKGIGMTSSLMLLAGVSMVGMIVTFLFTIETKGRSLEENENENENGTDSDFFVRGFRDCVRPKMSILNDEPSV